SATATSWSVQADPPDAPTSKLPCPRQPEGLPAKWARCRRHKNGYAPSGARHQQGTSQTAGGGLFTINKGGDVPRLEMPLVLGLPTSPPGLEYESGELGGLISGDCGPALAGWAVPV